MSTNNQLLSATWYHAPVQGLLEQWLLDFLVQVAHVDGVVNRTHIPHD